ncbi:24380_t:CDS:1, partial [Gigaspora margarita]
DELLETIKQLPLYKATGPQGISNKMLKQLPTITIDNLLNIFNACINLQNTPKA